ncbi:MAG: hypothetical protein U0P81_05260 [Holophagaceae bacterium]
MELDDLKAAWQDLNATLARQNAINLSLLAASRQEGLRRALRPLARGQGVQMTLGALLALTSAAFWVQHRAVPHLLAMGLLMHAYGVGLIVFGARVRSLVAALDFGAPVLELQRRMAALRRFYGLGYLWLGLPWWVLWVVALEMLLMAAFGVDLAARVPGVVITQLASGLAAWGLSLALGAWARRHPSLGPAFLRVIEGASLTRARAALDDLARFEAEAD